MPHRALIISDVRELMETLSLVLSEEGFHVVTAPDALEGMRRTYDMHPDLVIMEDRLSVSGPIDLCAHLSGLYTVAVIMIGEEDNGPCLIRGLDRGADFYLVRPFSIAEFVTKARALLRRRQGWPQEIHRVLDSERRSALTGKGWIDLTVTEFRLLSYLMLNRGRIVPAQEILDRVWPGEGISSSSLSFYIYRLRQKLNHGNPPAILTRHGVGYRVELNLSTGVQGPAGCPDAGHGRSSN